MTAATIDHRQEYAARFRGLHERDRPFVLPNPWDIGSARLLAAAGFEALATTSAGFAASVGKTDGALDAATTIDHVRALVAATDLPVSADLEDGLAADPAGVADVFTAIGNAGAVGGSIEDLDRRSGELYPLAEAVDRVTAAVEAARALPVDFVVTARCEAFGRLAQPDLGEVIRRLQAYQEAGADVLYAPGLRSLEQIRSVVAAVDRPVNVVMGLGGPTFSLDELAEAGVRRVSVGSALARCAYGALLRAIQEIRSVGTFEFAAGAVPYARLNELLSC
jgi:2-methylisocitrate lyase-like PEP mutase family enzyme